MGGNEEGRCYRTILVLSIPLSKWMVVTTLSVCNGVWPDWASLYAIYVAVTGQGVSAKPSPFKRCASYCYPLQDNSIECNTSKIAQTSSRGGVYPLRCDLGLRRRSQHWSSYKFLDMRFTTFCARVINLLGCV